MPELYSPFNHDTGVEQTRTGEERTGSPDDRHSSARSAPRHAVLKRAHYRHVPVADQYTQPTNE